MKVIQPVEINLNEVKPWTLNIKNKHDFISLENFKMMVELMVDGKVIGEYSENLGEVKPGESSDFPIKFDLSNPIEAYTDAWLNLRVVTISATEGLGKDHMIAWEQFQLMDAIQTIGVSGSHEKSEIELVETDTKVDLKGKSFSYTFNKLEGKLEDMTYAGNEVIYAGPSFNVWRAPIDNDMFVVKDWTEKGVNRIMNRVDDVSVKREADGIEISVDQYLSPPNGIWGIRLKQTYLVYSDGVVRLRTRTYPVGDTPEFLPRVGYRLTLPKGYSDVTWHGRGPGESYVDSKSANLVGTYTYDVKDMFTEYVYPQENGNRTDVRFMACSDSEGKGLFFYSRESFNFSIHEYSLEKLEAAKHTYELEEDNFLSLYIDHRHHGIGSNSCGPVPLKEHSLKPDYYDFDVYIRPFVGSDYELHKMFGERLL